MKSMTLTLAGKQGLMQQALHTLHAGYTLNTHIPSVHDVIKVSKD